jgi:UDP-N-acetylmuramoyl-tripeptide--D-alanyl-D-alanine ligase
MMDAAMAAQAISAKLHGDSAGFHGVTTDTRTLVPGDLFVAIQGPRFDGHDFVREAFERGAAAAIVAGDRVAQLRQRAPGGGPGPVLAVDDPIEALGALAAFWRRRFSIPIAAVVGSNGKTTVKEMIAAIMRAHFGEERILSSAGNLNNAIGLPLTLLRLRESHVAAVVEIGMNHPGETLALAKITLPTLGVINNAQREHQEFMKSVADVAAEHASLLGAMADGGVAVINADDDFAPFWREVVARRNAEGANIALRDFGLRGAAAVTARYRSEGWGSVVEAISPEGSVEFALRLPGRHNVTNALAAIAAAGAIGASLYASARALASFQPIAGRLQTSAGFGGATIIDDTYNANPDSVRAAVAVLAHAPHAKWLVLGDMGEIGGQGVAFHREIGEYARAAGVDRLLTVGELASNAADAFGPGGTHFDNVDSLAAELLSSLTADVTVLVKGSRFMRMERVVAAISAIKRREH